MFKPVHGVTKRTAILLWLFSASIILYFVNLGAGKPLELFNFISFAFGMIGAGVAYHVAVELIKCKQVESNEAVWRALLIQLSKVQLGYLGAGSSLFFGWWLGGATGYLIALVGMTLFMLLAFNLLVGAKKMIIALVGEDGF